MAFVVVSSVAVYRTVERAQDAVEDGMTERTRTGWANTVSTFIGDLFRGVDLAARSRASEQHDGQNSVPELMDVL